MNSVLQYFSDLEHRPVDRVAFLAASIFILWIIEGGIPLVTMHYRRNKWRHAFVNFSFTFFHLVIHASLAVYVVLICDWCVAHKFGMVQWLHLPVWGIVVAGILSMDFFGGWLVHWTEHKVPLFWRMHIVHHADTNVDVTSGLRHHPFEAFFRWVFFSAGILLMGLPIYAVMLAQTIMSMFTMFTHANMNLPAWVEKLFSWVLVTPNMHKVHHHYKQPYTDSNYGTAFSIWDHMFGTYQRLAPGDIQYGIDNYYQAEKDENLTELLKSPFASFKKKSRGGDDGGQMLDDRNG